MPFLPRILVPLLAVLFAAPLWAARSMVCNLPGMTARTFAPGDDCCAPPATVVVADATGCCVDAESPAVPGAMPDSDGPCFGCAIAVPEATVASASAFEGLGVAAPIERVAALLVVRSEINSGIPFPLVRPAPPTLVGLHAMLTC